MYLVCISGQLLMSILGAMMRRALNININSKRINLQAVMHSGERLLNKRAIFIMS